MFTLIKSLRTRELVFVQAPTIAMSLVFAELFYKFGSFLLEALAFLLTWFVLDVFRYAVFGEYPTND